MAIRIRKVKGYTIALCAKETMAKKGDIYLDDNAHHALTNKFYNDFKEEGLIRSGAKILKRIEFIIIVLILFPFALFLRFKDLIATKSGVSNK